LHDPSIALPRRIANWAWALIRQFCPSFVLVMLVYLFGSGAAFFLGIGCIFVGLAIVACTARRRPRTLSILLAVVGVILIALSSTPLPYWLYAVSFAVTLAWLVAERFDRPWFTRRRNCLRATVAAVWAVCAAVELPHHFLPTIGKIGRPTFYVIGDSVTAGMSDPRKDTWPNLLASAHGIDVIDLSQMGATAASAMKQADGLPAEGGLLLLEIGGNDLLGSPSAQQFAQDLDALLGRVCKPGRTVLIFELPLPPLSNDFGRAQRSLAAKHKVLLIPKRLFMNVLSADSATLDSIHLSPHGHAQMAALIWSLIHPAYGDD
jgi:acyl-CoA thioesterase-1